MGFPNKQNLAAGAIPVWGIGGVSPLPPGSALISYAQVTNLSAAVALSPPDGATTALVQVNDGIVRYRRDGTNPTASVGMLAYATGPVMAFYAPFTNLKFIQATGSTGSLNVEWYGPSA